MTDDRGLDEGTVGQQRRLWSILLLSFAMACAGGGGSCDGCGGGCGGCDLGGCDLGCDLGCGALDCGTGCDTTPFDEKGAIIEQSVQLRLSGEGIDFIEASAQPLIERFAGDSLSFCLEPTNVAVIGDICGSSPGNGCGSDSDCATDARCVGGTCQYNWCETVEGVQVGCSVDVELAGVDIVPADGGGGPDRLDVTAYLNLDEYVPIGACPALRLRGTNVPVSASVVFHVDNAAEGDAWVPGTSERIWFEVANVDAEFGALSISAAPDLDAFGGGISCGILSGTAGLLTGLVSGFVTGPINSSVESALCTPCAEDGSCPTGSSCSGDPEVCRYPDNERCVPQWLGTEGRLALGGFLGGFGADPDAGISYLLYLANYAEAEGGGFSLGARSGFYAAGDTCVPVVAEPDTTTVPRSSELTADRTPAGEPFMVGIGVSRQMMDLALWGVHQSGALCLAIGSDFVEQLSTGTFQIFVPTLGALTHSANAPMILTLRPQEAPYVTLGSGEISADDPPEVVDPLLTLHMDRLYIDFYAYVEERFVRLFTLDTDIALPLALAASPDGTGITPILGDLDDLFRRVEPIEAELFPSRELDALAGFLPSLIGVAAPQLASALSEPIALPEIEGIRLELPPGAFTSIEDETMLAIFANLALAEPSGAPALHFAPTATARLVEVLGPDAAVLESIDAARRRGGIVDPATMRSTVVLDVDTPGGRGRRAYSYRIDGGLWRTFTTADPLAIDDPVLLLEGPHTIEVRSRDAETHGDLSLISDPVEVFIDLGYPDVRLDRLDERTIAVQATDSAWVTADLEQRYRFDGGAWTDWAEVADITVPDDLVGPTADLDVEVVDPAGRSRFVTRQLAIHGRTTNTDTGGDDGCGGCAASGGSNGAGWWLLALGWLLVPRRTRRMRVRSAAGLAAWIALIVAVVVLGGCSEDPATGGLPGGQGTLDAGDDTSEDTGPDAPPGCEACSDDQLCVDDVCVENTCDADDECPDGMVCADDRCVERIVCADDTDCPEATFCIDDDGDGGSECLRAPCDDNAACSSYQCAGGEVAYCSDESCLCQVPCEEGCGEGQYCCNIRNRCEDLPAACEDLDCDPGFEPRLVRVGGGDPDSCETTGAECECAELPPLELGDTGAYLSAAAAPDGTIWLAAFNREYGDLVVGSTDGDDAIDWVFVDGLADSGPIVAAPSGPRGGVATAGPVVGMYTSIAVDAAGVVHVSYYDRTTARLRYARGAPEGEDRVWTSMTVDESVQGGLYTTITVDGAGVPGIGYFVPRAEPEPGVWHSQLRYAWADATEPTAWTVELVSDVLLDVPCGGACSTVRRCHEATNRCQETRGITCEPACESGQTCFLIEGTPECGVAVSTGSALDFLAEGSGVFADSARFSDGRVALSWYDHTRGNLMLAESGAGTFAGVVPRIVEGEGPDGADAGDMGWYGAVTVDAADGVHLTFVDATNDALRYRALSAEASEVVDEGVRGTPDVSREVLVGDDSSLVVLPDGTLQVAYMDATLHQAVVSHRPTDLGSWTEPAPFLGGEEPFEGAFGFFLEQVVVGERVFAVSYRIDTIAGVRDVVVRELE